MSDEAAVVQDAEIVRLRDRELLARWVNGAALSADDQQRLNTYLMVQMLSELEHLCSAITAIQAHDLREAAFALHERRAGYRPDDPSAMLKARADLERHERAERDRHRARRHRLARKVQARRQAH